VNYKSNRNTKFLNQKDKENNFLQYIQSLSPDTVAQLSRPESPEVFQVMEHNIMGMLGNLPSDNFHMTISTSKESLGRLLVSAMMSGYFLRNAEQRMDFEQALVMTDEVKDEKDNSSSE
jgi:hypothetical protein